MRKSTPSTAPVAQCPYLIRRTALGCVCRGSRLAKVATIYPDTELAASAYHVICEGERVLCPVYVGRTWAGRGYR